MGPKRKGTAAEPMLFDVTPEEALKKPKKPSKAALQHQEWLKQQPSRLKAWRQLVDDTLQGAGYRIQKIEARGDCCFIAMMAGDDREIPIVKVTSLNDNARDFYVTKKRKALVERFMTEVAGQKEGAWLTRKELLNVAVMLDMKLPKGRALAATGTQMQLDFNNLQMRNIKQAMRRAQPLTADRGSSCSV